MTAGPRLPSVIAAALAVALASAPPAASHSAREIQQSIRFDQRIGERIPAALRFRDSGGQPVRLGDLLAGRPTVLEMAWYSCGNLCPITLHNLSAALRDVPFAPGTDFNVITVSIDPREQRVKAAETRRAMLDAYGRKVAGGWRVLTGDHEAIRRLAGAIGFRYAYDERQEQFAHPAGLVLLDGSGRIARYLFGLEFAARDLKLALIEAGRGELGSPIDQIVLRCHSFDPATGRYTFAVMNLVRIAGAASVLALGGAMVLWLRRERRARPRPGERS